MENAVNIFNAMRKQTETSLNARLCEIYATSDAEKQNELIVDFRRDALCYCIIGVINPVEHGQLHIASERAIKRPVTVRLSEITSVTINETAIHTKQELHNVMRNSLSSYISMLIDGACADWHNNGVRDDTVEFIERLRTLIPRAILLANMCGVISKEEREQATQQSLACLETKQAKSIIFD